MASPALPAVCAMALAAAWLAAPAAAQPPQGGAEPPQGGTEPPQGGAEPPQGGAEPPQGGAEGGRRILLDRVIAAVGDRAILDSRIREEVEALTQGARGRGHTPSRAEIQRWQDEYLAKVYQTEALAQAGRTEAGTSLQQIEHLSEQQIADVERMEIERAGSITKYTRELGILGKTWDGVREEVRSDLLAALAQRHSIVMRFRRQLGLMVTPRAMRQRYEANLAQFVQEASSDVHAIILEVAGDPVAAARRAEDLAAAWRDSEATTEAIAEQFGAHTAFHHVRSSTADPTAAVIKEFAATAAEGEVSAPQRRGSAFWVFKLVARHPERRQAFSDPQVQQRLLEELVRERLEENHKRLLLRSERTFQPIQLGGRAWSR